MYDSIHEWSDGSGILVDHDRLEAWDSNDQSWVWDFAHHQGASNVFDIFAYGNFSDKVDTLVGNLVGHEEDAATGESFPFDMGELAYGLTYAGGGLENVSWRRLGELLEHVALEDVFTMIGVDLDQFTP